MTPIHFPFYILIFELCVSLWLEYNVSTIKVAFECSMKLICIDGNEANVSMQVGVSVYTHNMLHEFKKRSSSEVRFCVYLRSAPLFHMPRESNYFRYKIVWGPRGWNRVFLPMRLMYDYAKQCIRKVLFFPSISFHAFFAPAHYAPPWLPPGCRLVVTIHDLAFLFFPREFLKKDLYKLTEWTSQSVYRASDIITVSENTRQDVLKHYKVDSKSVHTVLNGYRFHKITTPEVPSKHFIIDGKKYPLVTREYVLYVGTLQPRKNIKTLLYAFALFHKEQPQQRLVIAGKKGWMYNEIFETAKKLHIEHVVHFMGYVSEVDRNKLYSHALCFVLPSLYEGFGIPLLEAFAASCPVLSSNSSSLPEVGGGAPLYFKPDSVQELLDKLRLVEKDFKLTYSMVERGLAQAQKFSWETCAEDTLELLLK